jgi:hypothetical protein
MQEQKHFIELNQRKQLKVEGVESVNAFSEAKIVLRLLSGDRMTILGSALKITGFSKSNGVFTAEGDFVGLSYGGKSLAQKIFK